MKNNYLDPQVEKKVSELFKTIADPTRIKILYTLKNKKMSVTEITEVLNMTQSAISHQLRILRDQNLVINNRLGKEVYYELSDNHVYQIFDQAIEHVIEDF